MRDNVMVAGISGELDLFSAETLGLDLIADTPAGTRGIVLDLSRITHLDSVGIAVIVGIRKTLLAREQRLALVIPQASRVHAMLDLVGLWEHVQRFETVDEAVSAFDSDEKSARTPSDSEGETGSTSEAAGDERAVP